MKANEMPYFSNLFDKIRYMFRTSLDDGQWNCLKHVEYFSNKLRNCPLRWLSL